MLVVSSQRKRGHLSHKLKPEHGERLWSQEQVEEPVRCESKGLALGEPTLILGTRTVWVHVWVGWVSGDLEADDRISGHLATVESHASQVYNRTLLRPVSCARDGGCLVDSVQVVSGIGASTRHTAEEILHDRRAVHREERRRRRQAFWLRNGCINNGPVEQASRARLLALQFCAE